jgi:phosphatidylinositol-3-phosphatase
MQKVARVLVTGAACVLGAGGCLNTSGSTDRSCAALSTTAAAPTADWGGTVFTIVMENKSASQIFGNSQAPFINQLAKQNAVASGYRDSNVHPSEPNYIWMVSGENFGILDDNDPGPENHIDSKSHLADQLEAAGLTWRSYQESMGQACDLHSHGNYAVKHNPFMFFDDINGWDGKQVNVTPRCSEHVVDYSQFDGDLASGKLPKYVFITPNLQDDMHDGTIAQGDAWLAREVPKILGSDAFNKGGVLFLLWDEGGGLIAGDDPPMIVISPNSKPGYTSKVAYDESSFLKTVEEIVGLQTLPCNSTPDSVKAMDDLFTVPLTGAAASPAPTPAPSLPAVATPALTSAPAPAATLPTIHLPTPTAPQ